MHTPDSSILILDFGSQVTQLIARRIREVGVYCEIVPFAKGGEAYTRMQPKGVILSGSPANISDENGPRIPENVLAADVPLLGICYGEQSLCYQLGGAVVASDHREFGRAEIEIVDDCAFFAGVWKKGDRPTVWMSHGDRIEAIPPGFRAVAVSAGAPFAAIANDEARRYGVQFHPEVVHTADGAALLKNFVVNVCGICRTGRWPDSARRKLPKSVNRWDRRR
jgi:GMP synthase (glutamine-hydrolysing)